MSLRRLTASLDRLFLARRLTLPSPPRVHRRTMASSHIPRAVEPVAIVGGGLAGLSAASKLAQLGVPATVFDMGTRQPGGRACSRVLRDDPRGLAFDHGAQFFAPHGADFAAEVRRWAAVGVAAPWSPRLGTLDASTLAFTPAADLQNLKNGGFCGSLHNFGKNSGSSSGGGSLFVGVPSMGAVPQLLASEIKSAGGSVKTGHKVTALSWSPSERVWTVEGVPGAPPSSGPAVASLFGRFSAVVVADALAALPDSAGYATGLEGPAAPAAVAAIAAAIQGISHNPVLSLMVGFVKPVEALPWDAVVAVGDAGGAAGGRRVGGFQWIARDSSKPGRRARIYASERENDAREHGEAECWVAVTSAERATEVLSRWPLHTAGGVYNPQTAEYREAVAKELLGDFLEVLRGAAGAQDGGVLPDVVYSHAQRWGRAFVTNPLPEAFLGAEEAAFAACGDFCGGGGGEAGAPAEAAWRSGQRAAEAVAKWLKRR